MKQLLTVLFCIVICTTSFSQITSAGSGNYDVGSTWVGGVAPSSTDAVLIQTGHTVTVRDNRTCCNFHIQSGGRVNINSGYTWTCLPASCTNNFGGSTAYDNTGTIAGAGTFYLNTSSSAGASPYYENNGTISVSNFIINNGMTTSYSIYYYNGYDAAGTISSSNFIIRNTTGNNTLFYNGAYVASTVSSSTVTVENLNTTWDSYVRYRNYSGSTSTNTTLYLNNSHTSSAWSYVENYGTMNIGNLTTSTSSGYLLTFTNFNGSTLNYSGSSVHSSIRLDVDDAVNTVNFNSSSVSQTIPVPKIYNTGAATTYYDLILSNSSTSYPNYVLSGNTQITNSITLTSGIANMAGYTVTLGTSTPAQGTLSRTAGHFYNGTFRRYYGSTNTTVGNDNSLFPLGTEYYAAKSTSYYRPLWFGMTSITGGYMDVSHTYSLPATNTTASHTDATWSGGTTLQGISNSYWTVSRTFLSTGSKYIRYGGTGYGTNTLADLNATQSTSVIGTFSAATNSVVPIEVNRTLSTSASFDNNWYIGTRNKTVSPLPITLLSFTATPDKDVVNLKWSTATEINNDYFTIERSKDALTFTPILTQKGAGNSNAVLNYFDVDPSPLNGISYYRLKQTDFNGQFSYSNIVSVNFDVDFSMSINPNPTNTIDGNILISGKENEFIEIQIINVLGEILYTKTIQLDKSQSYTLPLSQLSGIAHGTYFVKANSKNSLLTKPLVIE